MKPNRLPLVFSFKRLVLGNGFIAGVRMSGRAILGPDERGEVWITGVAPVGLAGGGMDRTVAFHEFRKAWVEILFDIAAEARSFPDFKDKCEAFLGSTHPAFAAEWDEALAEIRRQSYRDDSLPTASADEHEVWFEVVEVDLSDLAPERNEVDDGLRAAA